MGRAGQPSCREECTGQICGNISNLLTDLLSLIH